MPDSFFSKFLQDVEDFDTVSIFVHQFPDLDCKGSQLGLKLWLQQKYPDKKILAVCSNEGPLFDHPSDEEIEKSLAVLVDISNSARVEDPRWKLAARKYRIDHHVPVEVFADEEWIDDDATATCEMIALMLRQNHESISQDAAQHLYEGLIADNLRFSIDKVRPASFEAGAYLVEQGADVVAAARTAFASDYTSYAYETIVRSKAVRKSRFLFAVINADTYLRQGLSFAFAKEKVYALADVSDIEVWALFTMMEDGIHYAASLRSRTIPIRDLAVEYGGGGHECASGIKNLSVQDVYQLIEKLEKRSLTIAD